MYATNKNIIYFNNKYCKILTYHTWIYYYYFIFDRNIKKISYGMFKIETLEICTFVYAIVTFHIWNVELALKVLQCVSENIIQTPVTKTLFVGDESIRIL